jgi:tRNA (cytidine/uridine-2'-O-)-methyltransferase
VAYQAGYVFVFGPETRGLPPEILETFAPERHSRSINLSNSAAVVVYEAWRQIGFKGGV